MREEVPAEEPMRPEGDERPAVSPVESSTEAEAVEGATPPESDPGPAPGTWIGV